MKNLHILPTDKPSRLHLGNSGLVLCESVLSKYTINGQHIYITSDEEIKEGDWYLNTEEKNGVMNPFYGKLYIANQSIKEVSYDYMPNLKKIILTTDTDLIKDGVQPIDDEFLNWFVDNPSCEGVEVDKNWNYPLDKSWEYKIIIPKEEPCLFCEGTGQVVSSTTISGFKTCDCIFIPQEEPKQFSLDEDVYENTGMIIPKLPQQEQETLEEVAERILANNIDGLKDALQDDDLFFFYKGIIQCYGEAMAKYQYERMYSEEDMIEFGKYLLQLSNSAMSRKFNMKMLDSETGIKLTKDLFEQYKKK
jgi:hypothetical protein